MELGDDGGADGMELDCQSYDNKSLYICLEERIYGEESEVKNHFYAIRLADLNVICNQWSSGGSNFSESELQAPWKSINGSLSSRCDVYLSTIVIAGGKHMMYGYCEGSLTSIASRNVVTLDTDNGLGFRVFKVGKFLPIMAELEDKLYALPGPPLDKMHPQDFDNCFEVYDPKIGKWSPLSRPPYVSADLWWMKKLPRDICVAIVGSSILVCCGEGDDQELFRFDTVTEKWARIPFRCFDDGGASVFPFPSNGKNLVVGDLMFALDHARPWKVQIFRVHQGDLGIDFKAFPPLELPEHLFPSDFYPDRELQELVHLGGKRVCLVLIPDYYSEPKEWRIATIIFEFNKKKKGPDDDDFSLDCKLLAPHFFVSKSNPFSRISLCGAFVMDTKQGRDGQ